MIDVRSLVGDEWAEWYVLTPAQQTQCDKDWPMIARLVEALRSGAEAERAADRRYWAPLKLELEQLRHAR